MLDVDRLLVDLLPRADSDSAFDEADRTRPPAAETHSLRKQLFLPLEAVDPPVILGLEFQLDRLEIRRQM